MSSHAPLLDVNLGTIGQNYTDIRSYCSESECAAVVKANAYGHGALRTVTELLTHNCCTFFVVHLSEALEIEALVAKAGGRIFVLNGLNAAECRLYAHTCIQPVLCSPDQIQLWGDVSQGEPAAVFLETGFGRLGIQGAQDRNASMTLARNSIRVEVLMTHLACAEASTSQHPERQLDQFLERSQLYDFNQLSIANSAAVFRSPSFHLA